LQASLWVQGFPSLHPVPLAAKVQLARLLPSQRPEQEEPSPAQAARPSTGEPVTALQRPMLPETMHASHWPVHAVSQQTPSAHCPELHTCGVEQGVPLACLATQFIPLQ
jgi:hypothetical protein